MAHPWFNKPTPGIIYVPAPSVTKLALPLASASSIDPDLLESLCVIWGKYGDIEKIKADLLSPVGKGTLAKAFYFLLQQYREQTLKDHGIILDVDDTPVSPGVKVITKQYKSPPKKKIEADAMTGHAVPQSGRHSPPSPSCTPLPQPLGLTLPATHTSPIGPRLHHARPVSSRVREVPTRHRSMRVGHVTEPDNATPDFSNRARASMVSLLYPRGNQDPHSYLARNQRMFQPLTVPSAPPIEARFPGTPAYPSHNPYIIRAPVPISAVANEQVSTNSTNIEMQPATGSDMDWVNIQPCHEIISRRNEAQILQTPTRGYEKTFVGRPDYASPRRPGVEYGHRKTSNVDKENQQYNPQRLENNVVQARGGVSSGRLDGEHVGRELRNTLHGAHEVLKEKEKKSRRNVLHLSWVYKILIFQ